MVLHYNNTRERKSDESKKILENEPTNKQSLAFTSSHQAAVSSESSCDPDDLEFNLRWCTLLDRSVLPWPTNIISRRSCMDEGQGAREWFPPQSCYVLMIHRAFLRTSEVKVARWQWRQQEDTQKRESRTFSRWLPSPQVLILPLIFPLFSFFDSCLWFFPCLSRLMKWTKCGFW